MFLECGYGVFIMCRNKHDGGYWQVALLQSIQELDAGAFWHVDVEQQNVVRMVGQPIECLNRIVRRIEMADVTPGSQDIRQSHFGEWFIVHDQHPHRTRVNHDSASPAGPHIALALWANMCIASAPPLTSSD